MKMRKPFVALLLAASAAFAVTDREAGEFVIRKGGRVMVNGNREPIGQLADLPAGEIRITGVDLTGTLLDPKELSNIAGLTEVRELYLPGPSFTTGAGARTDGNAELKALAGLT